MIPPHILSFFTVCFWDHISQKQPCFRSLVESSLITNTWIPHQLIFFQNYFETITLTAKNPTALGRVSTKTGSEKFNVIDFGPAKYCLKIFFDNLCSSIVSNSLAHSQISTLHFSRVPIRPFSTTGQPLCVSSIWQNSCQLVVKYKSSTVFGIQDLSIAHTKIILKANVNAVKSNAFLTSSFSLGHYQSWSNCYGQICDGYTTLVLVNVDEGGSGLHEGKRLRINIFFVAVIKKNLKTPWNALWVLCFMAVMGFVFSGGYEFIFLFVPYVFGLECIFLTTCAQ